MRVQLGSGGSRRIWEKIILAWALQGFKKLEQQSFPTMLARRLFLLPMTQGESAASL
jgi:hypothetical protein